MRFRVEPSPAGGWHVKLAGHDGPVSRHDTEDEALARAASYERGSAVDGERVTLRDGSRIVVRQVVPEDRPLFVAGWERFGEASRQRRFMGVKQRLTQADLAFFTELDHDTHEALGALDPAGGDGLGVARYIRHPGRPDVAEAAVSVIDAWQGKGLGGALLERLCRRARDQGIRHFSAELRADNRAMLELFRRLGQTRVRRDAGELELDVELSLEVSHSPSLVISGGSGLADVAESARLAEQAGFASAWATEFYDRSATVALAAMAAATSTITLGSAIAYAFGRTPLVWVAEARDLDELTGGRLILGLGTGTRRMQRDWHGLDGEHPASRMEELVPLVRRLLRLHEGPIAHDGRFYRLHVTPTVPVTPPRRIDLPIYLAGVNPRMIQAAGTVGDGLVGHPLFTPEYVRDVARPALARGAERAGRGHALPIAGYLTCSVDDDRDAARQSARAVVAFNATVRTYGVIHRHHGWEQHAAAVRDRWQAGDFAGAVDAVPDEMLDAIALCGTPQEVRARYAQRWAGVYEHTLLWPPAFRGMDGVRAVIEAFADPVSTAAGG